MRFREDNPQDLARARTEVAAWRAQHPTVTDEELVTASVTGSTVTTVPCFVRCRWRSTGTTPGRSPEPRIQPGDSCE